MCLPLIAALPLWLVPSPQKGTSASASLEAWSRDLRSGTTSQAGKTARERGVEIQVKGSTYRVLYAHGCWGVDLQQLGADAVKLPDEACPSEARL